MIQLQKACFQNHLSQKNYRTRTYTTQQDSLSLSQILVHLLRHTDNFHGNVVKHFLTLSWCQLFGSVERFHWERSKPRVEWDYPLLCKQEQQCCLPRLSHSLKIPPLLQDLKRNHGNKTVTLHTLDRLLYFIRRFAAANLHKDSLRVLGNFRRLFYLLLHLSNLPNSKSIVSCVTRSKYCIFVEIVDLGKEKR